MEFILPLATLAIVQMLAVISPGQSFVVVSRLALSSGRKSAIFASLGMGFGSVLWAMAAIAGLAIILENAAWLYGLMKLAGGAYLIFLAVKIWRHAPSKIELSGTTSQQLSLKHSFGLGFMTQLANPKVVIFFGSIFFALLPANSEYWVYLVSLVIVFLNETIWYTLVSFFFSIEKTRQTYLKLKAWIDRGMASALGLLGGGLVADAADTLLMRQR
ncbi:LysE family translocator [Halovulum sp. GXIMD14793]